jgi:hypothetical protein
MQLQAGAYIRRLIQTQQATGCERQKWYLEVMFLGRRWGKKNIEKFES